MDEIIIVAAAVAAIAWVNWYFLLADRQVVGAKDVTGTQQVEIVVQGGYDPARVRVRKGRPVRLLFDRRETSSCSEEVVLPEFGIRRFLPPHEKTAVEFTPQRAGEFDFTCGMSMLHGKIVVEE